MTRNRTEFTDKKKAEIFKRDRATCCFSGANLWLLDAPLRYTWEADWVDHVHPASCGGESEIENGVCASATFNVKKRNNSADTAYLFEYGLPTPLYYSLHGPLAPELNERLDRMSHLEDTDWFFNRMINSVYLALNYLCWSKSWKELPGRKDDYWLKAAFKKLSEFRNRGGSAKSIKNRGIITKPSNHQRHLLSLCDQKTPKEFRNHALKLSAQFNRNSKIWEQYFSPEEYENEPMNYDRHRLKTYQSALRMRDKLTDDTFECIQADYAVRFGDS
jgi:hypothetical protein